MSEQIYPFKVKYKGHKVTQYNGWVYITDMNRREVLRIRIMKPKTKQELKELYDFNEVYIKGGG